MMLILMLLFTSPACSEELQKPDSGKKIKVFLFAGQSNMEGRAHGRRLSEEDQARLIKVQNRVQLAFNHKPLGPLNVVTPSKGIQKIYKRDRIFGPELFFGIALAEAMPEEKFLFIKLAAGSTSLFGCWNPAWSKEKASIMGEAKHPRLYQDFIAYVQQVLKGYSPEEYELCGVLWVQGESDSQVPEAEAAYGTNLQNLIEHVRLDVGRETLPFILFQVGSAKVGEGMKQAEAKFANVTLIRQSAKSGSPDFYEKMENGHYNVAGMKKLGNRFAKIYLETYFQK